jgi:hypothetical protein
MRSNLYEQEKKASCTLSTVYDFTAHLGRQSADTVSALIDRALLVADPTAPTCLLLTLTIIPLSNRHPHTRRERSPSPNEHNDWGIHQADLIAAQ